MNTRAIAWCMRIGFFITWVGILFIWPNALDALLLRGEYSTRYVPDLFVQIIEWIVILGWTWMTWFVITRPHRYWEV